MRFSLKDSFLLKKINWLLVGYIVVSYRLVGHQPIQTKVFTNESDAKAFMKVLRGNSLYPQIQFNRCDRTAPIIPVTDIPCGAEQVEK